MYPYEKKEDIEPRKIGMSKVTRSGQITLNRKIRNEIGVEIGDYIIFGKTEDNKLFILPAKCKNQEMIPDQDDKSKMP
jgi:AbrB family looped-hinge helix DNA binding protein